MNPTHNKFGIRHQSASLLGGGLCQVRVLYLCAGLEGNGWVVVAEVLEPPLQVVSGNQVSLVQHQHQLLPRLTRDGRLKLGHTGPGRITGVKHFQDDVCSLYHLGKQVWGGGGVKLGTSSNGQEKTIYSNTQWKVIPKQVTLVSIQNKTQIILSSCSTYIIQKLFFYFNNLSPCELHST